MRSVSIGEWVHRTDIERQIPARDDPRELIDVCWDYLVQYHLTRLSVTRTKQAARRATAGLIAARIARSATRPQTDLEKRVEAQDRAIARLLAFVPTRAKPIREDRLTAIIRDLTSLGREVFPGSQVVVTPENETDEETEACHRLVLRVEQPGTDPEVFAAGATRLHRFLAQELLPEEYLAINLFVEPDFSDER